MKNTDTTKIIAMAKHGYEDDIYLIESRSESAPYGIHSLTGWNDNIVLRYVIVYRGYYNDFGDHGHSYEIAYDDFTWAWNTFKQKLNDYNFEKVELCEDFANYGSFYCDGYEEKDYGPSNPWDAPGMKISDFIKGVY